MPGRMSYRSRPVGGHLRMRRFHQALLTTLCVAAILLLSSKVAAAPGSLDAGATGHPETMATAAP